MLEPFEEADVVRTPGHLVLPAFPLCIGRHLQTGQFSDPSFFLSALRRNTAKRPAQSRALTFAKSDENIMLSVVWQRFLTIPMSTDPIRLEA
jgi:hypothetical protein